MKMNKVAIKFGLIIILFGNIFSSCKTPEIYIYMTPEFKEKEKRLRFSLEEASNICRDYINKNNIKTENGYYSLDIIYDENYIFRTYYEPHNFKSGNYNLSGIWINGNTGKIKEVKGNKYIKVIFRLGQFHTYTRKY
ncbi:hypothetical protein [Riemerella anatipestifer]|uniref:hypothetical protein n=1 Tax=Riemerella anatipestifer TaxID=34085 RepID=UPI00129EBA8C|nr:hypothetical protein [Riemerella anatipestifer]MRM83999.1 hypothetical protein [Riemerella anatipestifer]